MSVKSTSIQENLQSSVKKRFIHSLQSRLWLVGVLSVGLLLALSAAGLSQGSNLGKSGKAQDSGDKVQSEVEFKISNLGQNGGKIPLTLENMQTKEKISILSGQKLNLKPGKYLASSFSDDLGGIKQEIKIEEKQAQAQKIDLKLEENIKGEEKEISATALDKPVEEKRIAPKIEEGDRLIFNPQNGKVVTIKNSSQNLENNPENRLRKANGEFGTDAEKEAEKESGKENGEEAQIADTPATTDSLSVNSEQKCQVYRPQISQNGRFLSFYKFCQKGEESGLWRKNLETGSEESLLKTTDMSNIVRTIVDPSGETVIFTKKTGEFGIAKNGRAEVILPQAYFSGATFSPSGEYLVVAFDPSNPASFLKDKKGEESAQNNQNKRKKPETNLAENFKLEVKAVRWQELLEKKSEANFQSLGFTFYVPRSVDYNHEFVTWQGDEKFLMGDSQEVFELGQTKEVKFDQQAKPGRQYVDKSGRKLRFFKHTLLDEKDQALAQNVEKVFATKNGLYYLSQGYLFRLNEQTPILAHPQELAQAAVEGENLYLVQTDGQMLKF